MSAKVHIHMHVSNLDKSREFYRAFLGAEPVKEKPGYTKFLPEWGPVNLALSQGGGPGAGPVDHLGIQVESTAEVMTQLARIKAAGLPVREEMAVDCCHANQDKFWVTDPDGVVSPQLRPRGRDALDDHPAREPRPADGESGGRLLLPVKGAPSWPRKTSRRW